MSWGVEQLDAQKEGISGNGDGVPKAERPEKA